MIFVKKAGTLEESENLDNLRETSSPEQMMRVNRLYFKSCQCPFHGVKGASEQHPEHHL